MSARISILQVIFWGEVALQVLIHPPPTPRRGILEWIASLILCLYPWDSHWRMVINDWLEEGLFFQLLFSYFVIYYMFYVTFSSHP